MATVPGRRSSPIRRAPQPRARGDLHLAAGLADTEAVIALTTGSTARAIAMASEAIHIAEQARSDRGRLTALITRARAHAAAGDHASAAADFEVAAAGSADLPARRREVLSAWADSLAALGQHDRAFALAREALDNR